MLIEFKRYWQSRIMLQYNLFYFMIDKRIKYSNFQEIELIT